MADMTRSQTPPHPWGILLVAVLSSVGLSTGALAQNGPEECTLSGLVLVAAADESDTPSGTGGVEERAVPRMGPGMTPPSQLEGASLEGNRLQAKPGYHLEPQQGGTAALRRNDGSGPSVQLSCRCFKGKGGCYMTIQGATTATCNTDSCTGACEMRATTGLMQRDSGLNYKEPPRG